MRHLFILTLCALVFAVISAQASAPSCDFIVRSTAIHTNKFEISRDLNLYAEYLPFKHSLGFIRMVRRLPRGSILVDVGAGNAIALEEALLENHSISGVAISYSRPPTARTGANTPGRFDYRSGDYIENMERDGKLRDLQGRVALISDVFGSLTYSRDIIRALQIDLNLLQTDGTLVFTIPTWRNYDVVDGVARLRAKPLLVNAVQSSGAVMDLAMHLRWWLSSIPGIQVIELGEFVASRDGFYEKSVALKIQKTAASVTLPHALALIDEDKGTPPVRIYQEISR